MSDQGAGGGRLEEFEAEVAQLRIRGGSAERERQFTMLGLLMVAVGLTLGLVMIFVSSGASDSRDLLTYISIGIFGLILAVAGSVLWLRYSMTRYLRYWLLRLIYEQRNPN